MQYIIKRTLKCKCREAQNMKPTLLNYLNALLIKLKPHRWCNGQRARIECGRSWIRVPSTQTKDYKIGICWFSAMHASLRRKSKDGLARNYNNVSEWSCMSIRGLLFK